MLDADDSLFVWDIGSIGLVFGLVLGRTNMELNEAIGVISKSAIMNSSAFFTATAVGYCIYKACAEELTIDKMFPFGMDFLLGPNGNDGSHDGLFRMVQQFVGPLSPAYPGLEILWDHMNNNGKGWSKFHEKMTERKKFGIFGECPRGYLAFPFSFLKLLKIISNEHRLATDRAVKKIDDLLERIRKERDERNNELKGIEDELERLRSLRDYLRECRNSILGEGKPNSEEDLSRLREFERQGIVEIIGEDPGLGTSTDLVIQRLSEFKSSRERERDKCLSDLEREFEAAQSAGEEVSKELEEKAASEVKEMLDILEGKVEESAGTGNENRQENHSYETDVAQMQMYDEDEVNVTGDLGNDQENHSYETDVAQMQMYDEDEVNVTGDLGNGDSMIREDISGPAEGYPRMIQPNFNYEPFRSYIRDRPENRGESVRRNMRMLKTPWHIPNIYDPPPKPKGGNRETVWDNPGVGMKCYGKSGVDDKNCEVERRDCLLL